MNTLTNQNIQKTVDLYFVDSSIVVEKYGDISTWDVSHVTNMSWLFDGKDLRNLDLSNWDVSNVTSMLGMFARSTVYPKNGIENWLPLNLADCDYMFYNAYWRGEDALFTLNSFSTNKLKFKTYGMFNNFYLVKEQKRLGVEVDITFWSADNVDQENCYAMFGGDSLTYSQGFLDSMQSWLSTEFPWSDEMNMKKLFIDYELE